MANPIELSFSNLPTAVSVLVGFLLFAAVVTCLVKTRQLRILTLLNDIGILVYLICSMPVLVIRRKYRRRFWKQIRPLRAFESEHFFLRNHGKPLYWFRATSAGEMRLACQMACCIQELQGNACFLFSYNTDYGEQVARRYAPKNSAICPLPIDFSFVLRPLLKKINPQACFVIENGRWPNTPVQAKRLNVPCILVNGRVSDRSFWQYRLFSTWLAPSFECFDHAYAQSATQAIRLAAIGLEPNRISVCGDLKIAVGESKHHSLEAERIKRKLRDGESLSIFAVSTHSGEDLVLVEQYMRLRIQHPRLRLIIAPRRIERAETLKRLFDAHDIAYASLSSLIENEPTRSSVAPIVLIDTFGLVPELLSLADIVFVGGSLVKKGGHNLVEAAQQRKPILIGPHFGNFRDLCQMFLQRGALQAVVNGQELYDALERLIESSELREQLGSAAFRTVREGDSLLSEISAELIEALDRGSSVAEVRYERVGRREAV